MKIIEELTKFYTDDPDFETRWPEGIKQDLREAETAFRDSNGLYKGERVNVSSIHPGCEVARHIDIFRGALADLYRELDELESTGDIK
jgi:hypothetical protein